ncbi:MAG: DUF3874 domain-containing protein [Prevotella sp.]|nr:DUF3874 domain-containing protein [Prevotella sp.]
MKFTAIRKDQRNQMHITMKSVEKFMERIQTDTKNRDVEGLRQHLQQPGSREFEYGQMYRLPMIYPSAELVRDVNGNLTMRQMNGILLLSASHLRGSEVLERVKSVTMTMPTTLAAFVGSSGESVKILVRISRPDGTLPQSEEEANAFLHDAYELVKSPYQALLGVPLDEIKHTISSGFRMTHDPHPLFRPEATPFLVDIHSTGLLTTTTLDEQRHDDYDLYTQYEHLYQRAATLMWYRVPDNADPDAILAELARQLCLANFPEEEAVTHIWAHYKYKTPLLFDEERIRATVGAVYAETKPDKRKSRQAEAVGREVRQLVGYLQKRYVFRYNTIMGYTEYRPNTTWFQDWQPVDERVINSFTMDVRLTGLNVWDKDVSRYVKSDKIRNYNPIEEYLWEVHGKWDGIDHIGRLAQTVPTKNPHWERWFRTWVLAMVAQWKGRNRRYGNSVAPLLISSQGYNKSTFCRSLLPNELQWGYTDNLSLDEKRPVLQAMSQMLLVNLDEFNQISPRVQEGFLKNTIQLARVKAKRPYGKHVEDFPRLASFIATTNIADVLADPTGNRRFIGIELTGPIDVRMRPNHEQIYAQAQALIDQGEPYWFDDQETRLIMQHNRQFQLKSPAEQYFHEQFKVAEDEKTGMWMTAAAILSSLRETYGVSLLKQTSLVAFGRALSNMEGMHHHHSVDGTQYCVTFK